jgi:hypothetical protein
MAMNKQREMLFFKTIINNLRLGLNYYLYGILWIRP